MTNEEKADEICKRHIFDSNHFDCCMEMAEWKDEQHAQEKQQWIDKAAEWLRMTMDFFNNGEFNTEKFVNDFKKEMKGEQS